MTSVRNNDRRFGFCERCGSVSDRAGRTREAREAARVKVLMSDWRLV